MFINYENTSKLILENVGDDIINTLGRTQPSKDHPSISNKFKPRPLGILIQDSYNNPFFPIRPLPRIDTSKLDMLLIYKRFRELYSQFEVTLLPWHFVIEFVQDHYFVFNTRPLDMFFPISSEEVLNRQELWDDVTKTFMTNKLFDIKEALHVLVIGDSNLDIYTLKFYELLGRMCIVPFVRYFKIMRTEYKSIVPLNMGRKFNFNLVSKFIKR
jgi:hypothetical protein